MTSVAGSALRRLLKREDGDATVESVIVLPGIFFILGALWVWHDIGRQEMLEQRINYTIGDMISRETDPLDTGYIDSIYDLVLSMLDSSTERSDMRVSVVRQVNDLEATTQHYSVVWSEARGARAPLSGNLDAMADRLPVMDRNDQVVIVETWRDYTPAVDAGILPYEIASYSFTRPRFAPQLKFATTEGTIVGTLTGTVDTAVVPETDTGTVAPVVDPVEDTSTTVSCGIFSWWCW